jgi:EmrB/QacA subfamily drug resistance transporter
MTPIQVATDDRRKPEEAAAMSSPDASVTTVDRNPTRSLLTVACVSTLVVNANTSAVSILLPAISEDTGSPISMLQWAVTGYSLVGAAVIVTSGALADVYGRRKIFIGGLILFVACCALIALTNSGLGVIIGRMLQGAAGSTLLAAGLSLLSTGSSGKGQLRAVSLWGAAAAIGAAAGPLVGGVLVDLASWQWLFWIDAAIAAACIPLTLRGVEESSDPTRPRSIDWWGTLLIGAILAPFILAVSEGADWGWTSPGVLVCFAITVVATVAFVAVERRVSAPLVDLALLRNTLLVAATIGILIGSGTINGLGFLVSIYFQDPSILGMSALEAGLATLPMTVALVVVAPLVVPLAARVGTRTVIAAGFAISTAGFLLLVFVKPSWTYLVFVLPLIAVAAGMGLSNGPCASIATTAVPEHEVGAASGISNMARYVGAAAMVAIAAALYVPTAAQPTPDDLANGFGRASLGLTIISAAGIALALLAARHRTPQVRPGDRTAAAATVSAHTVPHQTHLASATDKHSLAQHGPVQRDARAGDRRQARRRWRGAGRHEGRHRTDLCDARDRRAARRHRDPARPADRTAQRYGSVISRSRVRSRRSWRICCRPRCAVHSASTPATIPAAMGIAFAPRSATRTSRARASVGSGTRST